MGVTLHARNETENLYTSMDSVKKKEKHLKKHKARAQDLKIKSGFEIKKGPSSRNFRHSD